MVKNNTDDRSFINLELKSSLIIGFDYIPHKRLIIDVVLFEKQGAQLDLHFNKILGFKTTISFTKKLSIESHSVYSESDFLNAVKAMKQPEAVKIDLSELCHYQISGAEGTIDIIAENFSYNSVWELNT